MNIFVVIMLALLGFVLAFFLGFAISTVVNREDPIGDLRIDESDPEDGPYLFLELKNKPSTFKNFKGVVLNVINESYISQK